MKQIISIFLITIFVLLSNQLFAQKKGQIADSTQQIIITMLKDFYSKYIIVNDQMNEDTKKIEELKLKYCTVSFLRKINSKELEEDPFINGQDFNKEWVKTLTIKQALNKKEIYNVCFVVPYNKKVHCVNVLVKKVNNTWKIDDVFW